MTLQDPNNLNILVSHRVPQKPFFPTGDPRFLSLSSFATGLTDELGLGLQDQSLFPTVLILLDLVEASILCTGSSFEISAFQIDAGSCRQN